MVVWEEGGAGGLEVEGPRRRISNAGKESKSSFLYMFTLFILQIPSCWKMLICTVYRSSGPYVSLHILILHYIQYALGTLYSMHTGQWPRR